MLCWPHTTFGWILFGERGLVVVSTPSGTCSQVKKNVCNHARCVGKCSGLKAFSGSRLLGKMWLGNRGKVFKLQAASVAAVWLWATLVLSTCTGNRHVHNMRKELLQNVYKIRSAYLETQGSMLMQNFWGPGSYPVNHSEEDVFCSWRCPGLQLSPLLVAYFSPGNHDFVAATLAIFPFCNDAMWWAWPPPFASANKGSRIPTVAPPPLRKYKATLNLQKFNCHFWQFSRKLWKTAVALCGHAENLQKLNFGTFCCFPKIGKTGCGTTGRWKARNFNFAFFCRFPENHEKTFVAMRRYYMRHIAALSWNVQTLNFVIFATLPTSKIILRHYLALHALP